MQSRSKEQRYRGGVQHRSRDAVVQVQNTEVQRCRGKIAAEVKRCRAGAKVKRCRGWQRFLSRGAGCRVQVRV
jgi:hypothetical protein